MKKLFAITSLAVLLAVTPADARAHKDKASVSVVLVIAENPDPSIGTVTAPTMATAIEEIDALASLDPVCQAVPQVCAARTANTLYRVLYSDGTEEAIYN